MAPRPSLFILLALGLATLAADAATVTRDDLTPRQQLAAERAEINSRHEREQAACTERFASNACRDAARQRQRQALAQVQARQQALDEESRRSRALQRQSGIDRKQAEVERRSSLAPQAEADTLPLSAPRAASRRARSSSSNAAGKAAQRAEAARKRQQEIDADQARIKARIEKRAAQGRNPAPLPPVPGASAPT